MRARIKLSVRSVGAMVAPVFGILALAVLGTVGARAQGVPTFRAPTTAPTTTEPVLNSTVPSAPPLSSPATGPPRTIAPRFNPPTSTASTLNSPALGAPALGAASFRMEELDQLVAPVALYPDTLLAQVLIASTYPLEVAMAAQWLQQIQVCKASNLHRRSTHKIGTRA